MNYNELLNIDDFQKRENFNIERWEVSFYCKDCEEIVEVIREDEKKYIYSCEKCKWKNIVIWTYEWLKENYRIKNK